MTRQIILDTETTGLSHEHGHRLIEVGCIEMVNRRFTGRTFHQYINPNRVIDAGAVKVHGITNQFLADKPAFSKIAKALFDFIVGAELVIHNAAFDMGFLNAEFLNVDRKYIPLTQHCAVFDTLPLARKTHPGMPNSLDALCKRYGVDNSKREYHGALLDAQLLAQVYLRLTGGQTMMFAGDTGSSEELPASSVQVNVAGSMTLPVIGVSDEEREADRGFCEKYRIY